MLVDQFVAGQESFERFIWKATRAMNAASHMGGDSLDTPLKIRTFDAEAVQQYQVKLAKATNTLEEFQQLSETAQRQWLTKTLQARYEANKLELSRVAEQKTFVDKALERIRSIPWPDTHLKFKDLLEQHLSRYLEDYEYWQESQQELSAKLQDVEGYREQYLQELLRDVQYFSIQLQKASDYTASTDAAQWFGTLHELIPAPPEAVTPEFLEWVSDATSS